MVRVFESREARAAMREGDWRVVVAAREGERERRAARRAWRGSVLLSRWVRR